MRHICAYKCVCVCAVGAAPSGPRRAEWNLFNQIVGREFTCHFRAKRFSKTPRTVSENICACVCWGRRAVSSVTDDERSHAYKQGKLCKMGLGFAARPTHVCVSSLESPRTLGFWGHGCVLLLGCRRRRCYCVVVVVRLCVCVCGYSPNMR